MSGPLLGTLEDAEGATGPAKASRPEAGPPKPA